MMQKKPGLGVMIAVGKEPPRLGAPGQKSPVSPRNDQQETPGDEQREDSGAVNATPESVNYRTSAETCGRCEYMGQDGSCSFLGIPVEDGDSCNRFEAKGEDNPVAEHDAGGESFEGSEDRQ
jgi:hypothetical protein